ncbi:MAG: hypothetical protein J6Y29_01280 [Clostridiales bacterium]|nr:hypothetical protein [Clostridiales bacterium]
MAKKSNHIMGNGCQKKTRAGGTNSSIKMMIKIKINKYAVMKKNTYIFILLFMIMSCDLKKDKGVPMNYREIPDSVLEKLVIEKGDTSAYYDLFVSYLDYSPEKFLPYALIMANKYNYPQAYYDVYDRLWYLYENSDSLDVTTKKIALEYLEKAAQKGHTQARQTLEEYLEHESSVATR